ncbi:MAG TPA: DNA cytosine methyltransferase, partial [Thermoguttaceae bacterium]|nr:DNA cytosine methyltransferase [Thermoguttaceae bacterium]
MLDSASVPLGDRMTPLGDTCPKGSRHTAIDLFSGCGGLSLGLRQAGFGLVGAVEIDEFAAHTYCLNHPGVDVWEEDIREIEAWDFMDELGLDEFQLDLLAGCPPCQGFSSIPTLNGRYQINDERNDLIFDFLRFVEHLRPKTIMLENVPGLANDSRFDRFCRGLRRLKYEFAWDIRDMAAYGVAQRRKRLLLLGSIWQRIPFGWPRAKPRTVRMEIAHLKPAGRSGDPVHDFPESRSTRVQKLIARVPKDGGSRLDLGTKRQLRCHRECDGFKDVYGRMAWDDVAPTITSGCFNPSKGR